MENCGFMSRFLKICGCSCTHCTHANHGPYLYQILNLVEHFFKQALQLHSCCQVYVESGGQHTYNTFLHDSILPTRLHLNENIIFVINQKCLQTFINCFYLCLQLYSGSQSYDDLKNPFLVLNITKLPSIRLKTYLVNTYYSRVIQTYLVNLKIDFFHD